MAHSREPGTASAPSRRSFLAATAAVGGSLVAGSTTSRATAAAQPTARAAHRPAGMPGAGQLGFVLSHEQFRTDDLVAFARSAEQAGFRSVWASDHLQPWQPNERNAMFPWNTLSLVSQDTTTLDFGTGVTCPTYRHHPTQVAQAFASLGIEAPGRVFLGVGTGEALNERAATGSFGRYPERAARLIEAVTLIRRLWTGARTTFDGTYYRTVDLRLWDLPPQGVPIYIAGSGPKSAYLAGRYGDGWITGSADFMQPALRRAFDRGARAAGKDPAAMPKLVESFVVVGDVADAEYAARRWRFTVDPWTDLVYVPDPARIQQIAAQRWPLPRVYRDWPVSTDPTVHLRAARALIDLGATPYIHSGQADQQRVIDFYGDRVIPNL